MKLIALEWAARIVVAQLPRAKVIQKKLCGEKGLGNGLIFVVSFIFGKILNERILFFYVLVVQQ